MKIDRLRTLSQFIDYLETLTMKEFCKLAGYENYMTDIEWNSACYIITKRYNEYLKQNTDETELTFEMIEDEQLPKVILKTLEDVANYTNGQLRIKEIEI